MTTVPFAAGSTDTVVYGCKDVCMSPWVYMHVWSYMKRGQNQYCGSPRDKACTDIVPPRVGRLSLPLSSSYRALWTYEDDSPVHHEQAVLQDHTWSGPHEIPDTRWKGPYLLCSMLFRTFLYRIFLHRMLRITGN